MASPLDDPRASDLLASSPEELDALASQFDRVAGQARTAIGGLRGAHGDHRWTGGAADKFRTQLGKLPGDLHGVATSYSETATALRTYARDLAPIRSHFQTLAGHLQTAQGKLTTAQTTLTTAKSTLSTAQSAPKATSRTPAVKHATTAVHNASSAVNGLQGQVSGLDTRGFHLLDEFDTVRSRCVSAVNQAAGVAPQHHSSWFSSACGAIGNFMKDGGKFFEGMGVDVWDAAKSLPSDVVAVVEHPGDWHDWLKLGGDLGEVAGAVALVAAVVVCPVDALGFDAAAETIEGIGDVAETVGTITNDQKIGNDVFEAADGHGSWEDLGADGLGLVVDKVDPGADEADEAKELLENKSTAIKAFERAKASGKTNEGAFRSLSRDQRDLLKSSKRQLYRPSKLNRFKSTTEGQLKKAKLHKLKIEARNEGGHHIAEHGIDVGKDKIKEAVGGGDGDGGGDA